MASVTMGPSEDYELVVELYQDVEDHPSEFNSWEQEFVNDLYEKALENPQITFSKHQREKLKEINNG